VPHRLYERFEQCRENGWGDRSVHSVARLLEQAAGVRLRLQPYLDRDED